MRFVVAFLLAIAIAAAFAVARAPGADAVAAINTAQTDATKRWTRLRDMTEEFIFKAYPDDPLLYCWARSTDCRAQTEAWIAVVDDMRAQYRAAVLADDPALTPVVDRAEAQLVEKVNEIRRLHANVPVEDRVKTYYLSRDAASEGFRIYRHLPVEPRMSGIRAATMTTLGSLRAKLGF